MKELKRAIVKIGNFTDLYDLYNMQCTRKIIQEKWYIPKKILCQ